MFCKYIFNNCDRCTRFERIIFIIWWRICDDFTCLRHTRTLAYDSHCPHGSGRVHFNMDQNDVKANAAKPALQNRYPLSPLMDWSDRKKAWTQPTCWLRRQWIYFRCFWIGQIPTCDSGHAFESYKRFESLNCYPSLNATRWTFCRWSSRTEKVRC